MAAEPSSKGHGRRKLGMRSAATFAAEAAGLFPALERSCNRCDDRRKNATNRCKQCRAAWYCSRDCQRADWKEHKVTCRPPAKGDEPPPSCTSRVHALVSACYWRPGGCGSSCSLAHSPPMLLRNSRRGQGEAHCGRFRHQRHRYRRGKLFKSHACCAPPDARSVCAEADGETKDLEVRSSCPLPLVFSLLTRCTPHRMAKRHPNIHNEVLMERAVLTRLDHPHIAKLFHTFQDQICLYFLSEYVAEGELWSRLVEDERMVGCGATYARYFGIQLVDVIEYLHANGVAHVSRFASVVDPVILTHCGVHWQRDIKPENVMVRCSGHFRFRSCF